VTRKRQKLRGSVKKVIRSADPTEPEKAQIDIQEADELLQFNQLSATLVRGLDSRNHGAHHPVSGHLVLPAVSESQLRRSGEPHSADSLGCGF
jgi:hypothetical protein